MTSATGYAADPVRRTPAQGPGDALAGAPRKILSDRHVLALTIGIVVGAGIFRTPALVAEFSSSEAMLIGAWIAGGLLSILGALCYAELAASYPHFGGDYHFLQRAYGVRTAFLYGWARFSVIQTGSLALLAYVFGDYVAMVAPIGPYSSAIYAALVVIAVSGANWVGVKVGAQAQTLLTIAEVLGLVAVIAAAFLLAPAAPVETTAATEAGGAGGGALGLVMVFVLLTYGGWNEAVYLSAEVKDAPRRLGRLMVIGLGIVTVLYVLANLAFLRVLGLAGMASAEAVAAEAMQRALGGTGAVLISLIVALAALTSANATVITGARSLCALARAFPALRWAGRWRTDRDTPGNAILAQGAVALLLVFAGVFALDGFRLALEYTAPVFWVFLFLVGLALFVLRWREPQRARPFGVPLYPLVPSIFCATSLYLLYSSLVYAGTGAWVGVAVLALGGILLVFLKPHETEEMD